MPTGIYARKPLSERFWAKVDKTSHAPCWWWTGAKSGGYGEISKQGKPCDAHRVAYELVIGPIPKDLWVLHRCDNPSCVNPKHLFLGNNLDNVIDCHKKGGKLTNLVKTIRTLN